MPYSKFCIKIVVRFYIKPLEVKSCFTQLYAFLGFEGILGKEERDN
jgi:hypothetical protein